MGFSCITCVNQKLDFIIDINQAHYTNIEKCINIRLIDDFDQKIYDLDPLITRENKNGEMSKLSLQHQDIKRYELENTLKSAPNGVLYLCIIENKDLYIGINGDIYIFKDVSSKAGLRVDERYVHNALCNLQLIDINTIDFKSQTLRALDEQRYITNTNEVIISKEATLPTHESITFRKCLIAHKNSSDIAISGIPKACEDHALTLQLLGCDAQVDAMIAGFKKIMKAERTKSN